MREILLWLTIALNKKRLRINTKYKVFLKVFKTDIPNLNKNDVLATIDIDTRSNKVKVVFSEIIEQAKGKRFDSDEDRALFGVWDWINEFKNLIEKGRISLRYLIENSDKEVIAPNSEEGKSWGTFLPDQKDYLFLQQRLDENNEVLRNDDGVRLLWALKFKVEVEKKKFTVNGKEIPNLYDYEFNAIYINTIINTPNNIVKNTPKLPTACALSEFLSP